MTGLKGWCHSGYVSGVSNLTEDRGARDQAWPWLPWGDIHTHDVLWGGPSGLRKTQSSPVISLTFHCQFERGSLLTPYLLWEKWQMNNWELLWGPAHQVDKRSSSRYLAPRLIHHNEVYIFWLKSNLWDFQSKYNEVFTFGVSQKLVCMYIQKAFFFYA